MANNLIQLKRTSVSGRAANTSTLSNPGELALNMTDGILYSTNGSVVFEIGANNTNSTVSGNLTVKSIVANGSTGSNGSLLHTDGANSFWASKFYAGNADVIPVTPQYGDIWFSTEENKPYMWVNTGYFDTWFDFLPPTP